MNDLINEDLKIAMKNGDKFALSVIRMLKSALQLEKIKVNKDLSDNEILNVIKKQVKIRKDSIAEYQKYNKLDVVSDLEKEIAILNKYLPEELSEEEIVKVIDEAFKVVNPTSIKDMGKVMQEINSQNLNADMSLVSKLVKEKINNLN